MRLIPTLRVPEGFNVFVLDDSQERLDWFKKRLPNITWATTADGAIKAISDCSGHFDIVFLDHDLGMLDPFGYMATESTALPVAKYMATRGYDGLNVIIHSWNPIGAARMKVCLPHAETIPFGQFDLRLLKETKPTIGN